MVAIIDYGMGNIHSVAKVINTFGHESLVAQKGSDLNKADKIILPGVGAFADAMDELEKRNIKTVLIEQIKNRKPFLGICLGLQLLFGKSCEGTGSKGLGILSGVVKRFDNAGDLKIPHIGWNQIKPTPNKCRLLNNISSGSFVYFCHSYYVAPNDPEVVAATTDYGIEFSSVVCKDNVLGVQFHPEKSQLVGQKILENFINLC